MSIHRLARLCVAAALILGAKTAQAQERVVHLMLGGGVSLPQGDLGTGTNTGWNALAGIGVSSLMQPLGLRIEAGYHRFPFQSGISSGGEAVTSGTANVTYRLPMTNSSLSPYLIAGLGAYHVSCAGGTSCGSTTKFGWNAGLGTKLALLSLKWFAEARFNSVHAPAGNFRYIPVTVGLIL